MPLFAYAKFYVPRTFSELDVVSVIRVDHTGIRAGGKRLFQNILGSINTLVDVVIVGLSAA